MSDVYNTWKGINTSLPISKEPIVGMIYTGTKTRARIGSGATITGILIESYPVQGDAILRDKENFPHCVDYNSLKIVVDKK